MEAAVQTMVTPFPCSYWILSVKCLTLWSEYKHHYHPKNKNKKHTQHPYVLKKYLHYDQQLNLFKKI